MSILRELAEDINSIPINFESSDDVNIINRSYSIINNVNNKLKDYSDMLDIFEYYLNIIGLDIYKKYIIIKPFIKEENNL